MKATTVKQEFEMMGDDFQPAALPVVKRLIEKLLAYPEKGYATIWVSAAGGTANVIAGMLSRHLGISYETAHKELEIAGKELYPESVCSDWYMELYQLGHSDEPTHDVKTLVRAALGASVTLK